MNTLLNNFESINLKNMDTVKLMNRKECKYTVSSNSLLTVLNSVLDEYFILEIEGIKIMPYSSVYYDMPDFGLYTSHQNGKQNRYKVRSRTYGLTGQQFLELKFKNNKKRTIKRRVETTGQDSLLDNMDFLNKHLPFSTEGLEEKIEVKYNRITLVDKSMTERVTVDFNLSYSSGNYDSAHEGLAIIEVKFEGDKRDSKMINKLQEYRIKPLSFSKYCLGISSHYSEVKQNNMNIKIREINKLLSSNNIDKEENYKLERVS
ncbi:MAG: polyphosphate polymerase domain-containing protein [Spirochaetaceae bacterium]